MTTTAGRSGSAPPPAGQAGRAARRRSDRPVAPGRRRGPLARAVRVLRSMRTALWLLLAVAAAALVAMVIPQEPTAATTVAHWRAGVEGPGPAATALLDAAGVLDVFGSWWFAVLVGTLLASLVACLVPRHAALVRSWRLPPPAVGDLRRLRRRGIVRSPLPAAEATELVVRVLRRRRYRVRLIGESTSGRPPQVAAERGRRAREAGSLAFHTAIVAALAAVAVGHVGGFTGQVDLVEGETFTDTRLAYDRWRAGPAFGVADHDGTAVTLERFRTSTHPNGTPREFVATVSLAGRDGQPVLAGTEVAVNHPLVHEGTRVHLARYGLAPRVVVRDGGTGAVLHDAPVKLASAGPLAWRGVTTVGVPDDAGNQLALDLVLLPDAAVSADGRPVALGSGDGRAGALGPGETGEPVLLVDALSGPDVVRDDGGTRAVDRTGGTLGPTAVVRVGEAIPAGDGRLTVEIFAPTYWAGFQVTRTPGLRALLAAAVVLLVGLTISLRAYPRRVWVEVTPHGSGSEVLVAGAARDRQEHFTEELRRILLELEDRRAPARSVGARR